jgi:hypothetical protein
LALLEQDRVIEEEEIRSGRASSPEPQEVVAELTVVPITQTNTEPVNNLIGNDAWLTSSSNEQEVIMTLEEVVRALNQQEKQDQDLESPLALLGKDSLPNIFDNPENFTLPLDQIYSTVAETLQEFAASHLNTEGATSNDIVDTNAATATTANDINYLNAIAATHDINFIDAAAANNDINCIDSDLIDEYTWLIDQYKPLEPNPVNNVSSTIINYDDEDSEESEEEGGVAATTASYKESDEKENVNSQNAIALSHKASIIAVVMQEKNQRKSATSNTNASIDTTAPSISTKVANMTTYKNANDSATTIKDAIFNQKTSNNITNTDNGAVTNDNIISKRLSRSSNDEQGEVQEFPISIKRQPQQTKVIDPTQDHLKSIDNSITVHNIGSNANTAQYTTPTLNYNNRAQITTSDDSSKSNTTPRKSIKRKLVDNEDQPLEVRRSKRFKTARA